MKLGAEGQANIEVSASPDAVYALVADVERMGEWSPECRRCEWIDGATGPAVGAWFKGSNRRGLARWSNRLRVLTATPGREFSFVTQHRGRDMTRWTYRFEPNATGTTVIETFELLSDMPWYFRVADRLLMGVKDRKADLETNMGQTLQHLKDHLDNPDPVGPRNRAAHR